MKEKLTHHEIIDRIVEQTTSVIIQVSKESNWGFIRTYGGYVSHLLVIYINVL